jgi:hypothetical protein
MAIEPLASLRNAVLVETEGDTLPAGSGGAFAALLDGATAALGRADATTLSVATGSGSVAEAAVARAEADIELEVAAIAASRASNAVTTLLQTQV